MNSSSTNEIATILISELSRFLVEKYTSQKKDESYVLLNTYLNQSDIKHELIDVAERAESIFRGEANNRGHNSDVIQAINSLPLSDILQSKDFFKSFFLTKTKDIQPDDLNIFIDEIWSGSRVNRSEILTGLALYLSILHTELLRTRKFASILQSLQEISKQDSSLITSESTGELGKIASILTDIRNRLAGDSSTDAPLPAVKKKITRKQKTGR